MCFYYLYPTIKEPLFCTCEKCSAPFKVTYGGYSNRERCRIHVDNGHGQCRDCYQMLPCPRNCNHIRRRSLLARLLFC